MDPLCQILDQVKQYNGDSANYDADIFWKDLFVCHFVDDKAENRQDDLLFFVYKITELQRRTKNGEEPKPNIEVMRKCSRNLPLHICSINWEESFFLNVILQKLEYSIICTICTRTGPKHFQVLNKKRLNVFATPSSHSVLFKESIEQYSYPFINFYIENFEEFLYESIINDLESVYIEMLVKELSNDNEPFVIYSSWISYKSICESYGIDNRILCNGQYFGLLQVRDCKTDGSAEMVIKKKIKRSVSDGSSFSILREEEQANGDSEPVKKFDLYRQNLNRKVPPNKTASRGYFFSGYGGGGCGRRSRQSSERFLTIETCDVFDELEDDALSDMWSQPGFRQTYFEWKDRQRAASFSFHCFVTNISLPWNHIISQLFLSKKRNSILLT